MIGVDPALPLPSTEQLAEMMASERPWTNVYGPANMLLRNQGGGRFEPAEPESGATVWRHTYQASWSDYDRDGDPDLYLANDYGPNELLRNRGDGRFESAGAELEVEDLGFGMGASWGTTIATSTSTSTSATCSARRASGSPAGSPGPTRTWRRWHAETHCCATREIASSGSPGARASKGSSAPAGRGAVSSPISTTTAGST